jgi:hypothetical protein
MPNPRSNPDPNWLGLESGAVQISAFSPLLNGDVTSLVLSEKSRIMTGGQIFCGSLYNFNGTLVPGTAPGTCLSDGAMLSMLWFIQGTVNYGTFIVPPKPTPAPSPDNTPIIAGVAGGMGGGLFLMLLVVGCVFTYFYLQQQRRKRIQEDCRDRRRAALNKKGEKTEDYVFPQGLLVLVDTDVEASTALWEHDPEIMASSLILHDEVRR